MGGILLNFLGGFAFGLSVTAVVIFFATTFGGAARVLEEQ